MIPTGSAVGGGIPFATARTKRVPNSPTGQVVEAGPDWPVLVDVDDWTRLTRVVWSGLDWSQTSFYKRSHGSRNGTQANTKNRRIAIVGS